MIDLYTGRFPLIWRSVDLFGSMFMSSLPVKLRCVVQDQSLAKHKGGLFMRSNESQHHCTYTCNSWNSASRGLVYPARKLSRESKDLAKPPNQADTHKLVFLNHVLEEPQLLHGFSPTSQADSLHFINMACPGIPKHWVEKH